MSLTTQESLSGRLPAELTSFIGRRNELAEVVRLFAGSRLVTLMGPGGVGKTRLAVRSAHGLASSLEDGACYVDLSGLRESGLLTQAVSEAFGLPDQGPQAALDTLVNHLSAKRALLVLDNCEHLVDGCAMLAEVLLKNAPGLRILVTSRQPLDITGEYTLMVSPLAVPDSGRGPAMATGPSDGLPGWNNTIGTADEEPLPLAEPCDSMALFAERAAAVVSGWSLTTQNFPLVALLCNRLDGIPLAIELTAVQLRALSIEQVVTRLDRRMLRLRGLRSTLPRHQTLRAAIDWSHELCEPGERLLWARLSVFAGDFDLDDAEQVCADEDLPAEEILESLAGLVAQSIVQRVECGGAARYRMLDSLREYGTEQLEKLGQAEVLRARLFERFADVIGQAATELGTASQPYWLDWFRWEQTNVRAAVEYGLQHAPDMALLRMMLGVGRILVLQGLIGEARYWCKRVLAVRDADAMRTPEATEAFALFGLLTILGEDLAAGRDLVTEAEQRAREAGGDVRVLGYIRMVQGADALFSNRIDEAITLFRQAKGLHREAGEDDVLVPVTGLLLTATCVLSLRLKEAKKYADEVIATTEASGEQWCHSYALCLRGLAASLSSKGKRGMAELRDGMRVKHDLDDRLGLALAFDMAALALIGQGDYQTAARLAGASESTLHFTGASLFGPRHRDLRQLYTEQAKTVMGEDAFQAAYQRGATLPLETAIAEALGEPVPPPLPPAPRPTSEDLAPETFEAGAEGGRVPLTQRELEIAGMVAEGQTNREIAERLVIAKRTVDSHLEHILSKLSFTSRVQVATWYSQRP